MYEVAAACAFHLAESQAYFDGNKRTGVEAALVFLEGCGVDASRLPEDQTYDLMIRIAAHEAGRSDFADYLRSELGREKTPDWREPLEDEEALRQAEQRRQEQQERSNEGPVKGEGGRET